MSRLAPTAVLLAVLAPRAAHAQPPPADVTPAVQTMELSGSVRSMSSSWLILPDGWEMSGELRFLTSDAPPGGERLKMTDVVVSRASARKSFGGKLELAAGVDVLPKEQGGDEMLFQGADLQARYGIGRRWAAATSHAGGPMTDDLGWWTTSGASVQRRSIVHETLSFQLGLGASHTLLAFDDDRARMIEVVARGQTLFMVEDMFGVWLGADFAFPAWHTGEQMGVAFDPQTRVDVAVGAVYSVVDDWDVYLQYGIVDRGDLADPATQLPVLQGGFDQRVLTFGLTRHFYGGEDDDDDMYVAF